MNWLHWTLLGAIAAQSALLFWSGWLLRGVSRIGTRQNEALQQNLALMNDAAETINGLREENAALHAALEERGMRLTADVNELPPDKRAAVREALTSMLGELRKKDN